MTPEILKHKKFQAGFATSLFIFLGQVFPAYVETGNVATALAKINWFEVSTPILAAIAAQGVADFGKEKAKIERDFEADIQPAMKMPRTGQDGP